MPFYDPSAPLLNYFTSPQQRAYADNPFWGGAPSAPPPPPQWGAPSGYGGSGFAAPRPGQQPPPWALGGQPGPIPSPMPKQTPQQARQYPQQGGQPFPSPQNMPAPQPQQRPYTYGQSGVSPGMPTGQFQAGSYFGQPVNPTYGGQPYMTAPGQVNRGGIFTGQPTPSYRQNGAGMGGFSPPPQTPAGMAQQWGIYGGFQPSRPPTNPYAPRTHLR